MELFKINQDMTYADSPWVKNNRFLTEPAETAPLPKYDEVCHLLPQPVWDGREDVAACFDFAWRTAFGNLRPANPETNFVSNFIDTAFNGFLFLWDSSFIVMFGKYGQRAFNFQKTLDNFYSHQHRDGFICRELCENRPGEHFSRHDPASTGPNVLAWAEWEYYCQTGDTQRLSKIFDPLLAYHLWLKEHRTWPDGTYWSSGWGCGMDNQPRIQKGYHVGFSHGHMVWVDACIQQVLSAKILVKIAAIIGREQDACMPELEEEIRHLSAVINEKLWHEEDGFYYDLWKNGELNRVKSVGAYWALLADIIPADKLCRFVAHLDNEAEFNRPCRIPTLSADHPAYREDGGYWRGSVWAPTNYMVLKGLEHCGFDALAHEIGRNCMENAVAVFREKGTLYENYAPEKAAPGNPAKGDFVGWSGLFPISILFEYVFGIRPRAKDEKILWDVRLTEKHGVRNYPLNGLVLDLICEARATVDEEPVITAICDHPVEIEVHYGNKTKIIHAVAGIRP